MIIAISGKKGSGKDLVGTIIQYLTSNSKNLKFIDEQNGYQSSTFKIKKFADKLKDIVCLLINCTREQLEDREFKEKELGEEWWYYIIKLNNSASLVPYTETKGELKEDTLVKLTPRKLLQLLGTECGRNIIHPNIWVNALMSEYKPIKVSEKRTETLNLKSYKRPNWIITDMRFPNELKAVKDRGGISIRVNRIEKGKTYTIKDKSNGEVFEAIAGIDYRSYDDVVLRCKNNFVHRLSDYDIIHNDLHPSETALDNAEFDYVIDNNSTIGALTNTIEQILRQEKIMI